jgi:WD40 repeat protein
MRVKTKFLFIIFILILPSIFSFKNEISINGLMRETTPKTSDSNIRIYSIGGEIFHLTISSHGTFFMAASENKIYYFNKDMKSNPIWNYSMGGDGNTIHFLSMSSDGRNILVGSDTGRIYFFKNESSNLIWYYYLDDQWMDPLVGKISSDGNFIVVGSEDIFPTNGSIH